MFHLRLEFLVADAPITSRVTKFGGQPVWIGDPQWPLSRETGNPMEFICQIALDQAGRKMAYLFITSGDDSDMAETWDPDSGENAVIIQPSSVPPAVSIAAIATGPTLCKMVEVPGEDRLVPRACEFAVMTTRGEEPAFKPEPERAAMSEEEENAYNEALEGNKLGGSPLFIQNDEFPYRDGARLLLQLDATEVPFCVNFGDAGVGYAFMNREATAGKFLWQCA